MSFRLPFRTDELLSVINVDHDYRDHHVLSGVNLSLFPNDIAALVGENGAGKSTLLRIISGIIRPTQGEVVIGGFDVRRDRVRARQMLGYVPDVPFFYNRLRGIEHLAFAASVMQGTVETNISLAKRLGLPDGILQSSVGDYSLGTKQKLALAVAFGSGAKVLIMDEPFASLDVDSREVALALVGEFATSGGTALFVTHDSRDLTQCTRILKLGNGTLNEESR